MCYRYATLSPSAASQHSAKAVMAVGEESLNVMAANITQAEALVKSG
jgi:hypothetical protein